MEKPRYLYRISDFTIFEEVKPDTFKIKRDEHPDWIGNEWSINALDPDFFIPCTEDDFEDLKHKHNEYMDYVAWTSRSDGHGGSKGGTWEEFLSRFKLEYCDDCIQMTNHLHNWINDKMECQKCKRN